MVFDVQFRCFRRVVGCVVGVALRRVRVVSGRLVVAMLVVSCRIAMVLGRKFVMLGSLVVMLRRLLRHSAPPNLPKEIVLRGNKVGSLCYGEVTSG